MRYKQKLSVGLLRLAIVATCVSMNAQLANAAVFVAPFGGYSFGGSDLTTTDDNDVEQSRINMAESSHWGFMAGVSTDDPGSIYLLYSHQSTELNVTSDVSQDIRTSLAIDYLHIAGALYFPQGNFRPYITTSAGLTQMRPSGGFSNETHFSMAIGGGVEYQVTESFSVFADIRGYGTFISSSQSLFCHSGNCQWFVDAELMWQGQANIGAKIMF